MKNRLGVTLIELLLTLTILAVLAATATLTASALSSPRSDSLNLSAVSQRAITSGRPVNEMTETHGEVTALPTGLILRDSQPTAILHAYETH